MVDFPVLGTSFYMYNRAIGGNGKGSGYANCILQLNPNDKLRLVAFIEVATYTAKTVANACSITITKL